MQRRSQNWEEAPNERECPLAPTSMLLVRIIVGNVADTSRSVEILRNTLSDKEALEGLNADTKSLGTSVTEWSRVRNAAVDYCQRKKDQHRFDGQGNFGMRKVPTYDLMEQKEIIV
ncbi:hypothetical protein BDW68DRAFT_191726 [Aspergillus falconensis]